jgi:hypothetical protein
MRSGRDWILFCVTTGKQKPARQSIQYGGEIAATAISQNFFVGRFQTTAFSKEALEWKECTFCVRVRVRRERSRRHTGVALKKRAGMCRPVPIVCAGGF